MTENALHGVVRRIRADFPDAQALYLYGSAAAGEETPSSDVDFGLLLPHRLARETDTVGISETRFALEELVSRPVDLVNLRRAPIVLQKEVLATGRCIFVADARAVEEYEMIVLSLYGKLNEERAGILEDFARSKRAYCV